MGQRRYTGEYRANAVKLARETTAKTAARELNIPIDTLYTWISRVKKW